MKHIKHIIIAVLAVLIVNPALADWKDAAGALEALNATTETAGNVSANWGREAEISERGYIGAGGMYTAVDFDAPSGIDADDGYFGGRFYGGYMATDNLGAEVGYILGGDFDVSGNLMEGGRWTHTVKYSALYAAAVARLPIDDHLSLHGKLGVLSAREKISENPPLELNGAPFHPVRADNGKKILVGGGDQAQTHIALVRW